MKALRIALVLALVAGALTATSAFADRGGRHHHGSRLSLGFHFGVPFYQPYPYYYYPAPIYYPPPVVVQAPPQVYTERGDADVAPAPAAEQYWHYCASARGYYPYVKECPGGWERVPAAPAR